MNFYKIIVATRRIIPWLARYVNRLGALQLLLCLLCNAPTIEQAGAQTVSSSSPTPIILGMSVPLTGQNGVYGRQLRDGANALLARENKNGGVNGRPVTLIALDDGYEVSRSVLNTQQLIKDDGVFALIAYFGSATTIASLEVASNAHVPIVGATTGATGLQGSFHRYMFNTRASYADETAAIVRQALLQGQNKIAVLYQNDAFGQSGLTGVTDALHAQNLEVTASASIEHNSVDVREAVKKIAAARPQAVVMASLYRATAEFISETNALGEPPSYVTLSPVGADLLVEELGNAAARGVAISQVMPFPFSPTVPVVKEYLAALAATDHAPDPSYFGLEGYIDAKITVEGMRRTGKDLNRERFIGALESMTPFDLGGYRVTYTPQNHNGSKYVDLTVIGANGKILK